MSKTIKATLVIEGKNISVDELNDLFSGATAKIKGLSFLINDQAYNANNLKKYLFTAVKGTKSSAIEVDEIDLLNALPKIVKLAAKVGNKLDQAAYQESFPIFCDELLRGEDVHVCTRFLGMNLFITRLEDKSGSQKERSNKEWMESFIDKNLEKTRKGLSLDVSAVFLSKQPD